MQTCALAHQPTFCIATYISIDDDDRLVCTRCCSNIYLYTWSLCCVSDCRSCVLWCRQLSKIATENRQQIAIASTSSATATATTHSSILRAQFIISIVREHRAFARKSNDAAATTNRQTLNIIYSISCAFRSALACSTYAIAPPSTGTRGCIHTKQPHEPTLCRSFHFVCVCVFTRVLFSWDWIGLDVGWTIEQHHSHSHAHAIAVRWGRVFVAGSRPLKIRVRNESTNGAHHYQRRFRVFFSFLVLGICEIHIDTYCFRSVYNKIFREIERWRERKKPLQK